MTNVFIKITQQRKIPKLLTADRKSLFDFAHLVPFTTLILFLLLFLFPKSLVIAPQKWRTHTPAYRKLRTPSASKSAGKKPKTCPEMAAVQVISGTDVVKINVSNSHNDAISFERRYSKSLKISEFKVRADLGFRQGSLTQFYGSFDARWWSFSGG